MNEVTRTLERARRWMVLGRLGQLFIFLLTCALVVMTLALIAQRVFAFPLGWRLALVAGPAACVVAAGAWAWLTRPGLETVARRVDERAGLRETLSTGLWVRGNSDGWSAAAQEEAARVARGLVVRREFPVRAPRWWWTPIAAGGAFALAWWLMPTLDVLGEGAKQLAKSASAAEAQTVAAEVAQDKEKLDSMLAGIDEAKPGEGDPGESLKGAATPEEIRRSAVKRLTDVKDKLADVRSGEKGIKLDEMRDKMRDLRRPGPGPLDDMAKALQQGDFAGAKAALEAVQEQVAKGELTEEQQKKLKEQAKDLAGQLAALAEKKDAAEKALAEKGLDKKLATDLEGLEKALAENKELTEEQKKELRENCKGVAGACQQCQGMGKAMARVGKEGAGQMGQMGEQLSAMEMLQQQMNNADAAQKEALAQLDKLGQCMNQGDAMSLLSKYDQSGRGKKQEGEWSAKGGQGQAKGEQKGGGRGTGNGAEGNLEESAHKTEKSKANSPNRGGPIIGTMLVNGSQVRGESRAALTEAVSAAGAAAAEAIETNRIPKEYEGAVKRYFGRLEAKTKAAPAPGAPGAPAPAPEPAPAPAPATGTGG